MAETGDLRPHGVGVSFRRSGRRPIPLARSRQRSRADFRSPHFDQIWPRSDGLAGRRGVASGWRQQRWRDLAILGGR
jgi:hypothetical protein